ncbi:MAG: AAA family ATPase [Gammaproteobacteria bacterium]|nr:AAA family ATPase [Gammaproteobacteria bacterium]MBU1447179.1 AAA family ATPase [Gammaproteobacteria bacterium]
MIESIHFIDAGALQASDIHALGKINVVCGRNNSGKSTVLRSILDPTLRYLGRSLTSSDVEAICQSIMANTVFIQNGRYTGQGKHYHTLIQGVVDERDTWFAGTDDFVNMVGERYGTHNVLRGYQFNHGRLTAAVDKIIAPKPINSILIPPRRSMEESAGVAFGVKPVSNGQGLLNHLFYCQAQFEGTAERTLADELLLAFESVSEGFSYRIVPNSNNVLNLHFVSPNGTIASANQCGQGLQDLMILLFFAISSEFELLLIEEPESHLHPEMQRKLLAYFEERPNKQYVIATHSNVFLDSAYVDRVFQTKYEKAISIEDQTTRAALLSDLGYQVTDNLISDAVILVEGPTDVPAIETFLMKMGAYPKYQIRFWPLGGDIMDKVDLSLFTEAYKLFALVDQDPKSGTIRKRFVEKCNELDVPVCRLERYALENYFPLKAIREVFGAQVPVGLEALDPAKSVGEQLGFEIKKRTRNLAQKTELEELEGTDLLEFLRQVVSSCE